MRTLYRSSLEKNPGFFLFMYHYNGIYGFEYADESVQVVVAIESYLFFLSNNKCECFVALNIYDWLSNKDTKCSYVGKVFLSSLL